MGVQKRETENDAKIYPGARGLCGLALAEGMNMGGSAADKANMEAMQNDMPKNVARAMRTGTSSR
jgi:hypothetical protein